MEIDSTTAKRIKDIISVKESLKESQDDMKTSISDLAKELNVKPAAINKIIASVEKERKNRGTIADEQDLLDAASKIAR